MQEVTGSSPVPSTIQFVLEPDSLRKRVRVRFLFARGSEEGLLGTVNKQRQGIIVGDGILPFVLRNQVRFVRPWSSPYMARLGVVAAYVRTGSLYTSDKV